MRVLQEVQGVAEWQQPQAGMFIWLKLLAGVQDVDDIAAELVEANVMVLPGVLPNPTSPYLCHAACKTSRQDGTKVLMPYMKWNFGLPWLVFVVLAVLQHCPETWGDPALITCRCKG